MRPHAAERSRRTAAAPVWCEGCGGDRLAEVRVGRRWVGIGSIPLVPVGRNERRARCTSCAEELPLDALERPTTAALARHLAMVTRELAVAIVASGDPDHPALSARALAQVRTVAPHVDAAQLAHDVRRCDPLAAPALVVPLAEVLSVLGKEVVVADLARIALAAHTITPRQRWLIDVVGRDLGLARAHVCRLVTIAAAEAGPPSTG